jgi:hypothetical protein
MAPKSGKSSKQRDPQPVMLNEEDGSNTVDDYQHRRLLNNIAVRKSREKSRAQAKLTAGRVATLRRENDELEGKLSVLSKELGLLKELLVMRAGRKTATATVAGATSRLDEAVAEVSSSSCAGSSGTVADLNSVHRDHGSYVSHQRQTAK